MINSHSLSLYVSRAHDGFNDHFSGVYSFKIVEISMRNCRIFKRFRCSAVNLCITNSTFCLYIHLTESCRFSEKKIEYLLHSIIFSVITVPLMIRLSFSGLIFFFFRSLFHILFDGQRSIQEI